MSMNGLATSIRFRLNVPGAVIWSVPPIEASKVIGSLAPPPRTASEATLRVPAVMVVRPV